MVRTSQARLCVTSPVGHVAMIAALAVVLLGVPGAGWAQPSDDGPVDPYGGAAGDSPKDDGRSGTSGSAGDDAGTDDADRDRADAKQDDKASDAPSPPSPIDTTADVTDPEDAMKEAVAESLFERAKELYARGDYGNAKQLLVEALARSPNSEFAKDADALLRLANQKLGVEEVTAGTQVDDWGRPIDPYGESREKPEMGPFDPIDDIEQEDDEEPIPEIRARDDVAQTTRRALMIYGGVYGFVAGMALAGPEDERGETSGGSVLLGLVGAGSGMATAYWLAGKRQLSEAQGTAISWGGIWGAAAIGFFADVVSGIDTSTTNDIYKGLALGGLVGTGAGYIYARKADPSVGDVALVNSMGLYGTMSGLLLGVAMDPAESEAYSLNGLFGLSIGLGTGMYAASKLDTSRRRMLWIDIGALAGAAAPWALLYPLISDDSGTADEQTVGLISTLGMIGGGYLAWRLSKKVDQKENIGRKRLARRDLPVPSLVQRAADGRWSLGVPALKPAENLRLAPRTGARGVAVDLLGGRF